MTGHRLGPDLAAASLASSAGRDAAGRDSAGLPWQHRELTSTGFDHDDGTVADPVLIAALAGPREDAAFVDAAVMAAVVGARLLVPVVAEPVETAEGPDGLRHDVGVDMAVVLLRSPGGEQALPVFTSVGSLAAWRPDARPVPVTAARAAQAAVGDRCDALVIDVGSEHAYALRPSMVWALAQHRTWRPASTDPFVERGVAAAVVQEEAVTAYEVSDGEPRGSGVLQIGLTLCPGLSSDEVSALATRVGERLATDGELRARIDALTFRIG